MVSKAIFFSEHNGRSQDCSMFTIFLLWMVPFDTVIEQSVRVPFSYQELKYHNIDSLELNVFFLQIPIFLEFASLF